jgi:O-antigen/teichoic acid export membrane protein
MKRVLADENTRHYGPNTAWMLAERLLRMSTSLLAGIYLARRIGPHQYGLLSYALSFMTIFAPIANLGMDPLIVKGLVKDPEHRNQILGTSFGLRAIGFCVMFGLLAWTAFVVPSDPQAKWLILLVGLNGMQIPFQVIECHFQSLVQVRTSVLAQMTQCLVGASLTFWGASHSLPLTFFGGLEAFLGFVLLFGWVIGYRATGNQITCWEFDWKYGKQLVRATIPLGLTGLLYMLYTRMDHMVIERVLGATELGWYSVSVRLTETCFFIPLLVSNSLFPGLVKASLYNTYIYKKRLSQIYFFVTWLMAGIGLSLALLSHPLVLWLYGNSYAPAVRILCIYAWNVVPAGILTVLIKWLVNEGYYKICMIGYATGLIINVSTLFYVVPHFGLMGAALASLLSLPTGMTLVLSLTEEGRRHLKLILQAVVTSPF